MTYPAQWHQTYGDKTGASARAILPPLLRLFDAHSLLEVGCGNGHWTQSARDVGIDDYNVVDGPWNNREHLLVENDRFIEANLSVPLKLGRRYDMAICLEVAEHVQQASAATLVASLCDAADVVLFGAAIPLQGGYGHINEQWPSWWRDLFAARGYRAFDLVRPRHWDDASIHYWYRQNTFVYVRESDAAALATAQEAERESGGALALFDAVHPEKYIEMASYESIAMKKLLRRLPGWALRRIGIGGGD
ncbi:methyltransferase domain-containing protein [Croceicoccus ponticola]|uniref:Methyltransferase domain-containing protein n=1 Tax=Croceicoccus ponticola TaxID=2217664 RepID=A0A437GY28_9SPHN|nr:methyltransferase domain-containing protein [Croceicoccus ponticola]RVQ67591.1 methyltransferase domain-containing protein [Croceicoccus ponticola]